MLTRRHLLALGGATAASAALGGRATAAMGAASRDAVSINPMDLVNPEFRGTLESMLKMGGSWDITKSPLAQVRQQALSFVAPTLPTPVVEEHLIPGPRGAPEVRVFVVGGAPNQSKPAVLHMHGGGYVVGSARAAFRALQELVTTCDCVAVSVDYRLAPETRFPGSLEDNYAALSWLYKHSNELGVDRTRIAIMGESAGGGHAAALAIAARDRGEVPVAFQVLLYPMLDDRTGSSRPAPAQSGAYIWTAAQNRFGWSALLGKAAGSAVVPKGAVPARVTHLAGLPPAFIGVGSIDLFIDEDIEYARRLIAAGVSTEVLVIPGGFHGFDVLVPQASLSQQFTHSWQDALRRAFAQSHA